MTDWGNYIADFGIEISDLENNYKIQNNPQSTISARLNTLLFNFLK